MEPPREALQVAEVRAGRACGHLLFSEEGHERSQRIIGGNLEGLGWIGHAHRQEQQGWYKVVDSTAMTPYRWKASDLGKLVGPQRDGCLPLRHPGRTMALIKEVRP